MIKSNEYNIQLNFVYSLGFHFYHFLIYKLFTKGAGDEGGKSSGIEGLSSPA